MMNKKNLKITFYIILASITSAIFYQSLITDFLKTCLQLIKDSGFTGILFATLIVTFVITQIAKEALSKALKDKNYGLSRK